MYLPDRSVDPAQGVVSFVTVRSGVVGNLIVSDEGCVYRLRSFRNRICDHGGGNVAEQDVCRTAYDGIKSFQPVQAGRFAAQLVPAVKHHLTTGVQKGQQQGFGKQVGPEGNIIHITVGFSQ